MNCIWFLLLSFTIQSINNDIQHRIIEKTPSNLVIEIAIPETFCEETITRFVLSKTVPRASIIVSDAGAINTSNGSIVQPVINAGTPVPLWEYDLYPVTIRLSCENKGGRPFFHKARINIRYDEYGQISLPPSVGAVYKNLILNYEYDPAAKPAGMLIITPNSFYSAVLPLADWKEKKGWTVSVKTLSETGTSNTAIKNYITLAYNTWNPRPEYVILVGNKDSVPAFNMSGGSLTDHSYTTVDGSDFLSDLLIGRLSVNTVNELNTVIAKIVGYEKNPYTTETAWFKRALMVAADYPYDTMTTPIATKRWVREKMLNHGFTQVDSVYDPPVTNGVTPITSAVNQGVTFINYRGGTASWAGWSHPSFYKTDVPALANGWKLPVITSIVCWTGDFNSQTSFGETWLRAGNPVTPKGAVAFFGSTSTITHSRWNNCLDYGIYWGLFEDSIYNFGPMTYRGKLEVYLNFPFETSPDSGSEFYFDAYNILGDPSLEVWTDVPQNFIVSHSAAISVGANSFSVQVLNASSQPVQNALVSLYKRNEVKEVQFSDASGMAYFQIATSSPDTLFVTATRHNFKPYCGFSLVNNSNVYVGYESHAINDPGGNNNNQVNPGEQILMPVTLKNFGTVTTATGISAKLTTTDPFATIMDSVKTYSNIAPGGTATGAAYIFNVSSNIKHGYLLKFNLAVTSAQGNWSSLVYVNAMAPEFAFQRSQIVDGGNGILQPGETADLSVSIENTGGLAGTNINGTLRCTNPGITITDSSGSFGNIPVGDSAVNSSNRFQVNASSLITPGHVVSFYVVLAGDGSFRDTVNFSIIIGVVASNTPLGPDAYGYYAYDNTDTGYPEVPTYTWIEVDPSFGGSGTALTLQNDETKKINLPFAFKYYGLDYNKLSICSNGYAALDSTWIADMYNWRIPSTLGPPCLVAPFWDDLDPTATDSSRDVYYLSDATNHRFIVEWSRIQHIHNPTDPAPAELQIFEMVLYDPVYNSTITGDGEILFQYNRIKNDDRWHNYTTTGIEDSGHTTGLEYTFDSLYPAAAAGLVNGRAIKFTTDPPDPFPGVVERTGNRIQETGLVVYPNPFIKLTTICFSLGQSATQHGGAKAGEQNAEGEGRARNSMRSTPRLKIYNATGRLVKSYRISHAPSTNSIVWNGTDDAGHGVPAGVYFVELEVLRMGKGETVIQKVVLLR